MSVEYSLPGLGVLTSRPKHVGHAGEREILLAFFETTGGTSEVEPQDLKRLGREPVSNWRKTSGWDPLVNPAWHHEYVCAFHGVELAENGHVRALRLTGNGLVLALPGRMLRGLGKLQVLDLSDNDLRGGVPDEMAFECWPDLTHVRCTGGRVAPQPPDIPGPGPWPFCLHGPLSPPLTPLPGGSWSFRTTRTWVGRCRRPSRTRAGTSR